MRRLPAALWALAAAAVLVRLLAGLADDGIHWPDEVFQSLEPAHGLVHGRSLVAWEYVDGARTWALPGLFAGVLGAAGLLGLDQPGQYLPVVRLVLALLAGAVTLVTYALAREAGASRTAALVGAAAFALAAPSAFFGHRALGEVVTALPVALGLLLGLRRDPRWVWAGAALLALATLLRLQNGLFAAGLLVALVARRDLRAAAQAGAVLAAGALAYGLLDRLTWGGWFQSARVYLDFNVAQDGAARFFGSQPPWWYLDVLARSAPLLTGLALVGAAAAVRRAPALWAITATFVLALSLTGHKELRFLLPAAPLLCALAATGLEAAVPGRLRLPALAALAAAVAASALTLPRLTLYDVGQTSVRVADSAWGREGDLNRLLLEASGDPAVCGVLTVGVARVQTGAMTYLHRDARLYGPVAPAGAFSHVIERGRDGVLRLQRVREGCAPDPSYSTVVNQRPR